MAHVRVSIAVTLLAALAGCASMSLEGLLVHQVGYLEKCPEEKVKIVKVQPDLIHAEVDACGKVKRYQDISTHSGLDGDPRWEPLPEN